MTILSKRKMSAALVQKNEQLFRCPVCTSPMKVFELKSLVCKNKHSFDFAKQGYIHLLANGGKSKTKYDKDLFESRRNLMAENKFYEPVIQKIVQFLLIYTNNKSHLTILDTGCGDGSHVNNIHKKLHAYDINSTMIGIDIAKEGIQVAAKYYTDSIWCVADLAKSPFETGVFDVIINILSPSNYIEFGRLLKEDGVLIKVVPQTNYLKELRHAFYKESNKQNYTNVEIVNHFKDNFDCIDQNNIKYTTSLQQSALAALIEMTPLTWDADPKQKEQFLMQNKAQITVDVDILVGKKKQ